MSAESYPTILFFCLSEDQSYFSRLQTLSAMRGVRAKVYMGNPATAVEAALLARKAGATAAVTTNPQLLDKVLNAQVDYIPPVTRKAVTLDDYAGSIIDLPSIKGVAESIELLILNPLEHLITVSYGEFIFNRYLEKLSRRDKWFPQMPFSWRVFDWRDSTAAESLYSRWRDNARIIATDIETPESGESAEERRINCVGYSAYFPATHTCETIVIPLDSIESLTWVRRFNNLPQAKIFQNGMYDNAYFARWNSLPINWLHDTQHLFHAWYSELPKRLDFITSFALRRIRFWKNDGKTGNLEDYYRYNALDAWSTLNSYLALVRECPDWAIQNYLTEFPKVFPCFHCAMEGLRIDGERLQQVKAEKEKSSAERLARLQRLISEPHFNPNSPQQVKNLFTVLGVGHLPTTGKADMLKAKAAHPLNDFILTILTKYKEEAKLISTYFVETKFWNWRLYYALNPAGTDTGRLASKESAYWCGLQIQNIPRGDSVKQCIIADEGWLLCEIDKEQAEARCVGYLSGEEKLIELVESTKDYHSWNAAQFFGVPYEKIYNEETKKKLDPELRDLAKRTNHGANYNMGKNVMLDTMGPKNVVRAKQLLKLPAAYKLVDVCQYLLERYSATYPKVKGIYYESIVKRIELTKKLVSPLGWTRFFFGNPRKNKLHLNSAVAHEPQNFSVAIINEEFYNVWRCSVYGGYFHVDYLSKDKKREYRQCDLRGLIRLKAQIHDSIFFQYRADRPDLPGVVNDLMQTPVPVTGADGKVRTMLIPSDISAGKKRWSELK